jgi:ATP-dependent helicase/DNAse subunit B
MGTFAHRVLELTYAQLFDEGRANLDESDQGGLEHAREVLDANFCLHLEHQYMRAGGRTAYQALIAHSSAEEGQTDRLRRDLLSTLDYVSGRLKGFEPRAFEWEFGRGKHNHTQPGLPSLPHARYAGVAVTGTVDRIDVNAQGKAVIIDYKHKGPAGFFAEYAAFDKDGPQDDGFVLPRRIQSLMYAQIVQRAFPDLEVVGALYLGTRGTHALSGAVDELFCDAVFGGHLTKAGAKQASVPRDNDFGQQGARGMRALLDATEQAVAQKVELLRAGRIEADPLDANACSYCPVLNCERRMTR